MTNVATESDKTIISKLVKWNKQHLSDRQSTLILSFFIGLFAAIAAFILHSIIKEIQHLLTLDLQLPATTGYTCFSLS